MKLAPETNKPGQLSLQLFREEPGEALWDWASRQAQPSDPPARAEEEAAGASDAPGDGTCATGLFFSTSVAPKAGPSIFSPAPGSAPGLASGFWEQALSGAGDLDELAALCRTCSRCGLRAGCKQVVFGEGDPAATIMFVGEGPGQQEDELGRPFVGAAGRLLDRILEASGLKRSEVYIANVVKCRPPGNREPTPVEAESCWPNLRRQIELIRPKLMMCLGLTAARRLMNAPSMAQARKLTVNRDGIRITATYHPAALLRDPGRKALVWEDFKSLMKHYGDYIGGGSGRS